VAALGRIAIAAALAGCGDLHGLAPEPPTPLARIHVRTSGDIDAVRDPMSDPPRLRVALLWGQPWLTDPSCVPPYENADHEALARMACGDPLGFRMAGFMPTEDAALAPDGTATLDVHSLPPALFGDVFSQIAYGSVVVYDDRNGDGVMDIFGEILYGASLSSMTRPDTRVAFRHGGFDDRLAYYPRRGCEPPDPGYSLVSAGGFTLQQAVDAQVRGELPMQDPAQCRRDPIDREVVVALEPAEQFAAVGCFPFASQFFPATAGSGPRPDGDLSACTSIPDHGTGLGRGRYQLLTPLHFGTCQALQHLILRGCFTDPLCEQPEWDVAPPSWWPCPPEPPR